MFLEGIVRPKMHDSNIMRICCFHLSLGKKLVFPSDTVSFAKYVVYKQPIKTSVLVTTQRSIA